VYIVGTSGHIDHGKTSLIKALTGIDCDRLPEEKEREMTIDIGFSKIDYPKFGTVSIIDVPGHERFIRNMVVGAWGIDLALLVIAVDDSWMPQTEDHFRVIELLGIPGMIVVLTKIDIADQEMIEIAELEAKERLQSTRFENADFVRVSSRTGEGIDELKKIILENLKKLAKTRDAVKPYLFVDRVFESRGHGTVITGTLKNGTFSENDEVMILPGSRVARIKKIESHYHALNESSTSQRTALNLSGIAINEIKRGHIIVKNNFFSESGDIIAGISLLDKDRKIKNNLGIEVLIGTSSIKGKLIFLGEFDQGNVFPARIKFDDKWFFYPDEPFIITNPGGYRIIGGGRVLLHDFHAIKNKRSLKESIGVLENYTIKEIIGFTVKTKLAVGADAVRSLFPYSNKIIDKSVAALLDENSVIRAGDYIVDKEFYENSKKNISVIIKENVGLNIKEISDIARVDPGICRIILLEEQNENKIFEKDGRYFSVDSVTAETLSADKKKILSQLLEKKTEGIELDKIRDDNLKKNIKEMLRLGFVVSLDGNIIYHTEIYEELKKRIMDLFNKLERITISDVREVTGLSRKYLIPILNRIEDDGLIKRYGDFRIKI
jgi:selenocysteine-specific elongation factor